MKYNDFNFLIPAAVRPQVNENILMLIDSNEMQGVTPEEVYNTYTGIGGLHGLEFKDYDNRHQYTEAKKEIEGGQFFTPAHIACKMAALIDLKANEFIADLTAGAGIFANYFPEPNFYGCEIDGKAWKVSKYLYPDTRIDLQDIRYYKPDIRFDFIIGNPPFNLKWEVNKDTCKSQDFYFEKAAELLRPGGLILAIVPLSYCADLMFNKSDIDALDEKYNFLFQVEVQQDAFKMLGVKKFGTKVMCFQKKNAHLQELTYMPEFATWEAAATIFHTQKQLMRNLRIKSNSEMTDDAKEFVYRTNKLLFELKTHKALQPFYAKGMEYIEKFRNQRCPENMSYDDWYNKHRIKDTQVIKYLQKLVAKQSIKEIDKIALVKDNYGLRWKAYSNKRKKELQAIAGGLKGASFNEIILNDIQSKDFMRPLPAGINRLIERKRKAYQLQDTKFNDLEAPANISKFMREFTFMSKGKACYFNDIQHKDLCKVSTKEYDILNWQQGCGKTGGGYAWSKYKGRKTFIISSALSINLTWTKFLKENKQKFVNVRSLSEVHEIANADYVIISHGYVIKYERHIKETVKRLGYKVSLILDESDEITNHLAKRTRACKSIFQKVRHKLLTTGTTTRNNIAELYTQLELIYNNSINFLCTADHVYIEDKDKEIHEEVNLQKGKPFPARGGNRLFKQCFNPSKSTVLGIQQQNQNIYNEQELRHLIEKTIITRKFKEIAGDKYVVVNQPCYQSPAERHVYHTILTEFYSIWHLYYESTGNARKDAMLRIIRQIQLLIKATSTPQFFHEYKSSQAPNKAIAIFDKIAATEGKVAIGCITLDALEYYKDQIQKRFAGRPIFIIEGNVDFNKRGNIIDKFEATNSGILICTQQSLKSSVNIPACKEVFVESMQWNIPTIEQFYFRFIRYDSVGITTVTFFNYHDSIEANLLALLMAKEKLNDYIKTLEYRDNENMYNEFGIDLNILNLLITKEKSEEGGIQLRWGKQEIC